MPRSTHKKGLAHLCSALKLVSGTKSFRAPGIEPAAVDVVPGAGASSEASRAHTHRSPSCHVTTSMDGPVCVYVCVCVCVQAEVSTSSNAVLQSQAMINPKTHCQLCQLVYSCVSPLWNLAPCDQAGATLMPQEACLI